MATITGYSVDWGDGTPISTGPGGAQFAPTHTYAAVAVNTTYTVRSTTTQDDGQTAVVTSTVTVSATAVTKPAPAMVLTLSDLTGVAPMTVTATAGVTNSATAEPVTVYTFIWGDGETTVQAVADEPSAHIASHTYQQGVWAARVRGDTAQPAIFDESAAQTVRAVNGSVQVDVYRGGAVVATLAPGVTSYVDSGLTPGTAYTYYVRARNAQGISSAPSNTVVATTQAGATDTTPPSVPTGVAATGTTANSITLSWSPSTDNNAVASYRVTRNGVIAADAVSGTTWTDAGLVANSTHSYVVAARDVAGNLSAGSQPITATTGGGSSGQAALRVRDFLWADHDIDGTSRASGGATNDALAAADADHFPLIVAKPLNGSYNDAQVAAMKAAHPDLVICCYMNAMFVQDNQGTAFPDTWYARPVGSTAKLQSAGFGNYLMRPRIPAGGAWNDAAAFGGPPGATTGWIADRVAWAASVTGSKYLGVMMDMLGTSPISGNYVVTDYPTSAAGAIPADPDTGLAYTDTNWYIDTGRVAGQVKARNPDLFCIGNGLGAYGRHPGSAALWDSGIDALLAENWMRGRTQAMTTWPTEAQWVASINQIAPSNKAAGQRFLALSELVVASATTAQLNQWEAFLIASVMMGWTVRGDAISVLYGATYDPMRYVPWYDTIIGTPQGTPPRTTADKRQGVYQRTTSVGVVLVNPTAGTVTGIVLPAGSYTNAQDGVAYSGTISMLAHTALILTRAAGADVFTDTFQENF